MSGVISTILWSIKKAIIALFIDVLIEYLISLMTELLEQNTTDIPCRHLELNFGVRLERDWSCIYIVNLISCDDLKDFGLSLEHIFLIWTFSKPVEFHRGLIKFPLILKNVYVLDACFTDSIQEIFHLNIVR